MYYQVEKSGCCEHKGMVQIRFSFYLEPGDYGYEKHYVQVPEIPEEGYPEMLIIGDAESEKALHAWINSLPKKWQNNPFHNHFRCYHPNVTEEDIREDGKKFLSEAFDYWRRDEFPDIRNPGFVWPENSHNRKLACEIKLSELAARDIQGR